MADSSGGKEKESEKQTKSTSAESGKQAVATVTAVAATIPGESAVKEVLVAAAAGMPVKPETAKRDVPVVEEPTVEAPTGPTASDNPGIEDQKQVEATELVPSESVAYLDQLKKLLEGRGPLGGSGPFSETFSIAWRTDRARVEATRNFRLVERYPQLGVFGVSQFFLNYLGVNQRVERVVSFDLDWSWRVVTTTQARGSAVTLSEWVATALSDKEDKLQMISNLSRLRGSYFDGKVALSLAEALVGRQMETGMSSLSLLMKLYGYILSLLIPADDGLCGTSSIPANSDLDMGPLWFPKGVNPAIQIPAVNADLVSLSVFSAMLRGSCRPRQGTIADFGSVTLVIPVARTHIDRGNMFVALLHGYLQYPVKLIFRSGDVQDWGGPILMEDPQNPGNWIPAENDWYPASTLVYIEGADPTLAANVAYILFVLVEDYITEDGTYTLSLGAGVDLPLIGSPPLAWAPAVDISPALVAFWAGPDIVENVAIFEASIAYACKYLGSSAELFYAQRFWQSHICLSRISGEISDPVDRHTLLGPSFSSQKGWVDRNELLVPTQANHYLAMPFSVPVNGIFMYPSVEFDRVTGQGANNPQVVHYSVTAFDQVLTVGYAAGLIQYTEKCEVHTVLAEDIAHTVLCGSYFVSLATDVMLASNSIPRQLLWHRMQIQGERPRRLVRESQESLWGRKGLPVLENEVNFPSLVAKWLVDGWFLIHYPTNGVILNNAAPMPGGFGPGTLALARFDLPSLTAYAKEWVSLSQDSVLSIGDVFGDFNQYSRDPVRLRRDVGVMVPYPSEKWSLAWHLSTQLDGLAANGQEIPIYRVLRTAEMDLLQERSFIGLPLFSPLNWGSLCSIGQGDVIQTYIQFEPSDWSLSSGRPLSSFSFETNMPLVIIFQDKGIAYSTNRMVRYKPAYYVGSGESKYDPLGPFWVQRRGLCNLKL